MKTPRRDQFISSVERSSPCLLLRRVEQLARGIVPHVEIAERV